VKKDGERTYCQKCAYTYNNNYPTYLLYSVATSSASASSSQSEVGEWAGEKDLEEAEYTHTGEALCEVLVPGGWFVVLVVVTIAWS
jgi:hypothetical protein